ncbi:MAG TPA: heat-inducible transcriptional repressor HrcA [Edaphobacter sp.]
MADRMTARQRAILTTVIESYIETGEPVGSQTIARMQAGEGSGISSATIRNEMAALAEAGLLDQPHTSAGRIPTAQAFRLYVEELIGADARIDAARLSERSRRQIDSSFAGVAGTNALLERTSHVLATFSSGVGVAIAAVAHGDLLEHVHFSRLAPARVLAVVVTRSGLVRDRVLALDHDLRPQELEKAANFLNENFRGWNVERVRAELARLVERERSEYQQMLHSAQQLWTGALPVSVIPPEAVYVDGVANLIGSEADSERLREMLAALEEKQRLIELLNAYIDAKQESVRVIFDLDRQAPEMAGLVLIATPARMGGEACGALAVLGPKRMDYKNTLNAVSYISRVFDRVMYAT